MALQRPHRLGLIGAALATTLLATTRHQAPAAAPAPGDGPPAFNRRTGLFETSFSLFRLAAQRGDRADVARLAERIGAVRLAAALHSAVREDVLLALSGVAALSGNIRLLESVISLLQAPDADIVERAAQTVAGMLEGRDPLAAENWETPPDALKRACTALGALGASTTAALIPRLTAIATLAETFTACAAAAPLADLLQDPLPEIRRATLLAITGGTPASTTVAAVRARLSDPDPAVAAAAAVVTCRLRLRETAATPGGDAPDDHAVFRALVQSASCAPEDAVELLPCLASSSAAADKKVLEDLRRAGPQVLRDRARELMGATP